MRAYPCETKFHASNMTMYNLQSCHHIFIAVNDREREKSHCGQHDRFKKTRLIDINVRSLAPHPEVTSELWTQDIHSHKSIR